MRYRHLFVLGTAHASTHAHCASPALLQGCGAIDDHLLRGGLRPGQLVEFCGESGKRAAGASGWCLRSRCLELQ